MRVEFWPGLTRDSTLGPSEDFQIVARKSDLAPSQNSRMSSVEDHARTVKDAEERAAHVLSEVREILNSPAVLRAASDIRSELLIDPVDSFGYERPQSSSVQGLSDWQDEVAVPHSAGVLSQEKEIRPHIADAINKPSPFREPSARARPSLRAAVRYVAGFKDEPSALTVDRRRREARCVQIASRPEMRESERKLNSLKSAPSRRVTAPSARLSLLGALMIACGLPDVSFVAEVVAGFATVGDYPDSGWFRLAEREALRDFDGLDHVAQQARVVDELMAKATSGRPQDAEELAITTSKSKEELKKGLAYGGTDGQGYTHSEVCARLGPHFHPLKRFAVHQGFKADGSPKYRVCDNARSSLTNECLSTHETIACEDASFPSLACELFAREFDDGTPP